ncbi:sterol desaturase family protein [Qipengyuania sp. DY56-A-20]|jgi:sterol desaturase/sphingolipid hydroxylase (fatty acid hydroxylase superfamily)|uniref:Sterol desaturase family protein n=1 Tax=Qipengyuania benthica TaxID=3067651 RepID=A0ABT9HA81_9SPHN|nr:sterol desaturase family protein [Qipengyuania sp. DY56-A-20]MDP4540227.1 sterol desaturase family protein [Qipengyuania sp. DY56-A-20]
MDPQSPLLALIALAATALVFVALAAVELAVPRRRLRHGRSRRWITNLGLFALDTALVRLAVPLLMIGTAQLAEVRGWGLFNQFALPFWLELLLVLALLDLALFLQHWATHRVPLLWRLHQVHHADPDFDVTTAARFHPLEIALSMLYKMAVVAALGPAALAVFVFEVVFVAATVFVHANLSLPPALDRSARSAIVTPDMHRIHHSTLQRETNSNFGTMLSGWDRLFGTYRDRAQAGQDGLTIGLAEYQDRRPLGLWWSLVLPFRHRARLADKAKGPQSG